MKFRTRGLLTALVLVSFGTFTRAEEKAGSPQNEGIVFVGSSIFQFWTHLAEQMAPLPVLNRAIAGTVTQDMLDGMEPLVLRYHPRIVVYYCGSNDISSGENAEAILEHSVLGRPKGFLQGHRDEPAFGETFVEEKVFKEV